LLCDPATLRERARLLGPHDASTRRATPSQQRRCWHSSPPYVAYRRDGLRARGTMLAAARRIKSKKCSAAGGSKPIRRPERCKSAGPQVALTSIICNASLVTSKFVHCTGNIVRRSEEMSDTMSVSAECASSTSFGGANRCCRNDGPTRDRHRLARPLRPRTSGSATSVPMPRR
jgi:hypothetical protein